MVPPFFVVSAPFAAISISVHEMFHVKHWRACQTAASGSRCLPVSDRGAFGPLSFPVIAAEFLYSIRDLIADSHKPPLAWRHGGPWAAKP